MDDPLFYLLRVIFAIGFFVMGTLCFRIAYLLLFEKVAI